jgi:5-methylcytosine-specific restriction endonuclease McrA
MKTCTRCDFKSDTPTQDFPADKGRKDGLNSWCRSCYAERARDWYATNREQARATQALYYLENPDKIKADAAAWQKAHPDQVNAGARVRYAKNPEPILAAQAALRAKYPEKEQLRHAKYSREHPELRLANEQKRRAEKHGTLHNDLTHPQWLEIQAAQNHRCYYCKKRCKGKLTQDHITPLSASGSHTLHNVIAVCRTCNSRKGKREAPIPVQPLLLTIAPAKPKKKRSASYVLAPNTP